MTAWAWSKAHLIIWQLDLIALFEIQSYITKKFMFFIMPLALHGYNVTVHDGVVTKTIKTTSITLCDNELCAF